MSVGTEEDYEYPQWYTSEAFSVTMDGKVVSENVSLFWPVTLGQTYVITTNTISLTSD